MMIALAQYLPKSPEILPMTRRRKHPHVIEVYDPETKTTKIYDPKTNTPPETNYRLQQVAIKRRYYQKQQPPEPERWTHVQFQQWVKAMGYPRRTVDSVYETLPYEPKPIAQDLGIKTNRVYVYWRGYDKKPDVACELPATTTLLCKALLVLKRLGKWPL